MKQNIAATVRALVEPAMTEMGYSVWDVTFYKEGQEQILEVELENDDVFSIEDCQKASHVINPILDEADPIEQAYNLQVQSPGIKRELCRDFHFECYLGEKIQVRLIKAFEGKREYKGTLIDYDNDSVTIAIDEETEMNILKKEASWIKADDFEGIGNID